MQTNGLLQRMAARLSQLKQQSHIRVPAEVDGVDLCSNDYLGLATDLRLRAALFEAIENGDRMGSTGSRLLSGHHPAWDELEAEFAAFAGQESALFFSSGYAANTGLLGALLTAGDVVFSDASNHASIIDGVRLARSQKVIYPHCDLDFLEDALRRHAHDSGARVIVTESIFSMDGDRAPLRALFSLAQKYGAEVIVDEAHATGICGPQGRGELAALSLEGEALEDQALAVVHTCGKALASAGAFVCGSRVLKNFLINHARSFIFSTALPPYFARYVSTVVRIAHSMEAERARVAMLAAEMRERLRALGFDCRASGSHIVPLVIGGNEETLRLASALQESGFAVRAIRSPSVPAGTERLRLSLTARLSLADVERFCAALSAVSVLA
jgi:8-amino-7-oxononanoate synthase